MLYRFWAVFILVNMTSASSLLAQSLTETISEVWGLSNLSYKAVVKEKDLFSDKIHTDTLLAHFDLSNHKTLFNIKGTKVEEVYDGNKLIKMDVDALTYRMANSLENAIFLDKSVPGIVLSLQQDLKKKIPFIVREDSLINGKSYFNLSITEIDTVKKGRRVYRIVQLLIDKINHLPVYYRSEQQGFIDGTDMFIETYAEVYFYDYQVNQNDFVDLSSFVIPPSFSIEKTRTKYLLPNGGKAPDLDLTYSNGDPFLLKKQKGKVVLLNFTATGCPHGMESINMLNNLYSKYKAEHFIIVTIHPEDDKEAVERYNKKGNVQYPLFLNTAPHVADKYNVENYPTFYLVDKKGIIIKTFTGYYDSLNQELNDLIKKHL